MRPSRPAAVLALLGALLVTSCSSQPDTTTAPDAAATAEPSAPATTPASPSPAPPAEPSPAPSPAAVITISSFEYAVPASVRPGERVVVVNEDREAHTVTVDRGAIRLTVPPGGTADMTAPTAPGPHPIVCDFHGGMDAVLVVA